MGLPDCHVTHTSLLAEKCADVWNFPWGCATITTYCIVEVKGISLY